MSAHNYLPTYYYKYINLLLVDYYTLKKAIIRQLIEVVIICGLRQRTIAKMLWFS